MPRVVVASLLATVFALVAVLSAGCAARRPNSLPDLSADAPEELIEPHQAADQAYAQCAESYNSARIPWQGPVALATGGLAALGLAGAAAAPMIANGVLPPHLSGPAATVSVGVLGLVAGVSAGATAYLGAQVWPAVERTQVQGRLLQIVESQAVEAAANEDVEMLERLSREIHEDCRAVQAAADARRAEVVIRDLQRYRQEALDAQTRAAEAASARDELTEKNTTLKAELTGRENELKRWEAKSAAVEERIALLEANLAEKQSEAAGLQGEVDRLEQEQALLSEEKKKLLKEKKKLEEKTSHYEDVAAALKSEVSEGRVALRRLQNGVVVEMQNKVLFPSGKAELNEQGLQTLARVAEAIKGLKDRRVRIEGHTDSVPLSKNSEYASNWDLSAARALSVTKYLQELGVNPALMSAEARSQYAPAASNRSRRGRARNRRIEIYLVPQPKGEAAKWKGEG